MVQNPQIHEGLQFLLEHMPPHLKIILITRKDPPFPLSRLRANNQVCELRAADLIFTHKEAAEFLSETMQLHLNESQVGQILRRTEGWITGLQLAALTQSNSSDPEEIRIPAEINQDLSQHYLTEEVFNRQTPEIQDFLLRTSVLENLSAPLCNALLDDQQNAQQILDYLDHGNLFVTSLDDGGKWYRYHPLFSETLRRRLSELHPEMIASLHARASDWCSQNGYFEEALNHALATGENERIINLLKKYAFQAIRKGDVLDLLRWIKKIPLDLIESSPLLCLVYSWDLILSLELENGALWLERAVLLLDDPNRAVMDKDLEQQIRGSILALNSVLAASNGEGEKAIEYSRQALELLPPENSFSHSYALLDQGVTLSLNGNLSEAVQALQDTIRVSQSAGNWMVMMIARCDLGDVLISRGELNRALTTFRQSLSIANPPKSVGTGFEGLLLIGIGEVFLQRNQIAEANEALRKGIALSKAWLPMLYELDAHLHLAHLLESQGDYRAADEEFQLARELAEKSAGNLDDTVIELREAQYALQRGDIELALNWAQRNHLLDRDPSEYSHSLPFSFAATVYLLHARLFLQMGMREKDSRYFVQAIDLLEGILPKFEDMKYILSLIEGLWLLALLYQETGNSSSMIACIQKALALAEPEKIRQIFLDEGLPSARLFTHYLAYQKKNKAAASLPTRAFVTDLLFRLTGKETTENLEEEHPATQGTAYELLTQRELEVIRLAAGGRSNQEIALELHLSINTVKRHLNNIFMKLGASTRTQAIALAHQQGLLH